MFDTVIINKKLKQPKQVVSLLKSVGVEYTNEYQTKDLDNALLRFEIDEKGQIFEFVHKPTGKKKEYVPPFAGWIDNRSFLERLFLDKDRNITPYKVDETKEVKQKSKLTATFIAGAYYEVGGRYISLDYQVIAVDGKCKKINLTGCEIETEQKAKERRDNDAIWVRQIKEDSAKRREFHAKWYYPALKELYNPFVFFSKRAIQKICNSIVNLTFKWHGV